MPICPRGHDSQAEDWCDVCGFPMAQSRGQAAEPSYGPPGPAPAPLSPPPYVEPQNTQGLVTCPICRTPQTGRYCEECGYDYDLAGAGHGRVQPPSWGSPHPDGGGGYPQHQPSGGYGYPQPPAQDPFGAQAPPAHRPQQGRPAPPAPHRPPVGGLGGTTSGRGVPAPSYSGYDTDFRLTPPSAQGQPPAPGNPEPLRATWIAVVTADHDYFTEMMARSGPEAQGLYFPPYCPERRIPLTGRGQLRIGRRSQHRGTVPEIDLSVPPEDPGASHRHALLQEQPDGTWVVVDQDSTNGTTLNGAAEPIAAHTPVPLDDGDRIHVGAWTTITLHRA